MKRFLFAVSVFAVAFVGYVLAQSAPSFTQGMIPTIAQWQSYFSGKVDVTNGTLTNPTITGGSVGGFITVNADATGATDASTAINAALTSTNSQGVTQNVHLPCGRYHLANPITVGSTNGTVSQYLIMDYWCTIFDVSTDFNATALGVVNIAVNGTGSGSSVQYGVIGAHFQFHQPLDATATTSAATTSGNTLTMTSVPATVVVGSYVYDATHASAIYAFLTSGSKNTSTTVTAISGNTLTLSQNVASTVSSGDTINFAQPRANFKTLAQGCSLTAGNAGCKYPWAIYNNGQSLTEFKNIFIEGAWDGIYERGSTYRIAHVYGGALDRLLDQDSSFNFPQIDDFEMWNFGFNNDSTTAFPSGGHAFVQNYYDGSPICANLGESDGLAAGKIQCWTGKLNLSTNWTWGSFDQIMMDGTNADFVANGQSGGWTQIGTMYSTKSQDPNPAITVTSGRVIVNQLHADSASRSATAGAGNILVNGGVLQVYGGRLWAGETSAIPDNSVTSGRLEVRNTMFDMGGGCGAMAAVGYFKQSGTGVLVLDGDNFTNSCSASPLIGANFTADVAGNWINNITAWNNWSVGTPTGTFSTGALGVYEASAAQADVNVTGGASTQVLTQKIVLLSGGGGGGITVTLNGCGTNNDGKKITYIDNTGLAISGPHTFTPVAGSIVTPGTTSYSLAVNYGSVTFTCVGSLSTWKLN